MVVIWEHPELFLYVEFLIQNRGAPVFQSALKNYIITPICPRLTFQSKEGGESPYILISYLRSDHV